MTEEEKKQMQRRIIWIIKSLDIQSIDSLEKVAMLLGKDVTVDDVCSCLKSASTVFSANSKYVEQANAILKHHNYKTASQKRVADGKIKKYKIPQEELIEITKKISSKDDRITIRDAAKMYGYSKSTIQGSITPERVGEELYSQYSSMAEYHKVTTNQDESKKRK